MVPIHTHAPVHHRTPAYLDPAMRRKPYDEEMADNSAETTDTIGVAHLLNTKNTRDVLWVWTLLSSFVRRRDIENSN